MSSAVVTRLAACAVVALVCLVAESRARATVMVELSIEDLVAGADAIIVGRVERVGVRFASWQGTLEPRTVAIVRVQQWLKGAGGSTITIEEIGGRWQGGGRWIAGTPVYRAGEEVIVFLRVDPAFAPSFRTYGMAQGKFEIQRGVPGVPHSVGRDRSELGIARWRQGRMQVAPAEAEAPVELEVFLETVRALVRRTR
ncbi:MAG: hypothetical protein NZ898_09690 [Myxococcota bacterium]|nr:hypothetical protein [Myxococcota bacterium]MDW8361332.1 hypothetical protein [Myxococcales bacterium]